MNYKNLNPLNPSIDSVFLLTNKIEESPAGGRELLCKINYDLLKNLHGDKCTAIELPKSSINDLKAIFNAFNGHIDGINDNTLVNCLQIIKEKKIDKIFVDGSNFGEFVRVVKKQLPKVQVYTFFHNVESRFFLGALKQTKIPKALAVLIVNYLAERKAVRYSDKIICLNQRDSELLKRVYGRSATDLSAMALEDKLPLVKDVSTNKDKEKFALFVGGTFYANRTGIFWFVKHVAPHISIKTYIVGRGFEKFKAELEVNTNVVVVGEVNSLAQWYQDAYFVIAPIFDGSGMKTKVAEALMYGKKIIGTPEAFSGYEDIIEQAGRVCLSADEFILAIESSDKMVKSSFDKDLRTIYEDHYSFDAAKMRLTKIMG